MRTIAVGVDGLTDSLPAVRWAARELRSTPARLLLLHCVEEPAVGARPADWAVGPGRVRNEERPAATLRAAADECYAIAPDARVVLEFSWQTPRVTLEHAARRASLLVLGARSHRRPGLRLGSTSRYLAAHAACPVVVVRDDQRAVTGHDLPRGVVAGVDGSLAALRAVEVAADDAAAHGDDLTLVASWFGAVVPTLRAGDLLRHQAATEAHHRRQLQEATSLVRHRHPQVRVSADLVEGGFASEVLLSRARDARLLVVGRRGHGPLVSAVLGSTSQAVLDHAEVPVLVVPDGKPVQPDAASAPVMTQGLTPRSRARS